MMDGSGLCVYERIGGCGELLCDICGCGCGSGRNGVCREGTVISFFMGQWNNGIMVFLMLRLVWSNLG